MIGVLCNTNLTQELVPLIAKLRRVLKMQRICNFLDLQKNYQVKSKNSKKRELHQMYNNFLKNAKAWPKIIQALQLHANYLIWKPQGHFS